MNIDDFVISRHAVERILDMRIEPQDVRECLMRPIRVRGQRSYPEHDLYEYGDFACVVHRETKTVVTVVWRTHEAWKADLSAGQYGGRSVRLQ